MESYEIEEMLFDSAVRTKIRAPLAERIANIGFNRMVTSGVVAGAALVCTLAMASPAPSSQANAQPQNNGVGRSQVNAGRGRGNGVSSGTDAGETESDVAGISMDRASN